MSHQCIADAFAPAEARYKSLVLANTWGHLAPRKNRTYKGYAIYALGCFGDDHLNPTALECEFKGLDSSPWFFDALMEFLGAQEGETGGVYRFDGTFRNYNFHGTIQQLQLLTSQDTK
jgi:hypothetical protein